MIPNCAGCEEEWGYMLELVEQGYCVATTKENNLFQKGHYFILVVNNKGKKVAW